MTQSYAKAAAGVELPITLSRGFSISAWFTLFRLSVRQFVRGRRLLALMALFMLPIVLTRVIHHFNPQYDQEIAQTEEILVFYMIPQALVPLTALVLSSGMIRDEVEGQTLTYLLIRPLPRPSIYVAKLLAAWFVSASLAIVFLTGTLAAVHWEAADLWGTILPQRAAHVGLLSALSLLVYVSLFGGLSLVVRWILPLGVAYIVMFEGVFANINFMVRRLTVLWYVRILAERWLGLHFESWNIDLATAPSGAEALWTLLAAAFVMTFFFACLFGYREIRVKTPEGG